ncbi:MAG: hypothetical protein LUG62_00285 [Clostridiales bacterium]|nr:hypothetical protein [Clostridiales bacterium]
MEQRLREHSKKTKKLAGRIRLARSFVKNRKKIWKVSKSIALVLEKRM